MIPADRKACQVRKYNPFVMGGNVHSVCGAKPDWIIRETVPGKDGKKGSQSCCDACRLAWEETTGVVGVDKTWKWEKIK